MPIIPNVVERYLNALTLASRNGTVPDWLDREKKGTHFNLKAFGFNFHEQPNAFSEAMFRDQAEYITASINLVMKRHYSHKPNQKFHIVGHSLGCMTSLLIEKEINDLG